MISRWFKLLWRFWPGLVCLAVVFLLLAYLLEPRPRTISVLPFKVPMSALDHALSRDGKYLATKATGVVTGHGAYHSSITLHDLAAQCQVFAEHNYIDDFRFDDDGNLVYLITQRHRGEGKEERKQIILWRPGEPKGKVVWEHDDVGSRAGERIIKHLGSIVRTYFQLSPDARTLLFVTFDKTQVRGEFIDSATGKVRQTFTLTSQNREGIMLHEIHTVFTCDSKTVIVQTSEIEPNKAVQQGHWHWIDAETGQILQVMKMPDKLIIQGFLFSSTTTLIAQATNSEGERYFVFINKNQLQAVKLDEIKHPSYFDKLIGSLDGAYLAYQWMSHREISKNEAQLLPGWALRETSSGKLLQVFSTADQNNSHKSDDKQRGNLVGLLPGPYLLFQQVGVQNGVIQEWLNKARTWLGIEQQRMGQLYLIDGKNGELVETVHVPQEQTAAFLSQDGTSLKVITGYYEKIEVRTFDYPLHQPWLLIWTWALGVAGGMTLLVEARRWWRRRKSRGIQSPLPSPTPQGTLAG